MHLLLKSLWPGSEAVQSDRRAKWKIGWQSLTEENIAQHCTSWWRLLDWIIYSKKLTKHIRRHEAFAEKTEAQCTINHGASYNYKQVCWGTCPGETQKYSIAKEKNTVEGRWKETWTRLNLWSESIKTEEILHNMARAEGGSFCRKRWTKHIRAALRRCKLIIKYLHQMNVWSIWWKDVGWIIQMKPILIYQGVYCCTKVCNLHLDDSFSKSRDNWMYWTRCNLLKWKGIYKKLWTIYWPIAANLLYLQWFLD